MVLRASERATQLICEIARGSAAAETGVAGTPPAPPTGFSLRYERGNELIGAEVEPAEADRILKDSVSRNSGEPASNPPGEFESSRADLQREVDLIEEIVRVFGIDRVPSADSEPVYADLAGRSALQLRNAAARAADRARLLKPELQPWSVGSIFELKGVAVTLNEGFFELV